MNFATPQRTLMNLRLLPLLFWPVKDTHSVKAGFHMFSDDRRSQIAESSAIVCDHMETHFCDRLRSPTII